MDARIVQPCLTRHRTAGPPMSARTDLGRILSFRETMPQTDGGAAPVCWACALFMWAKRRAPRAAVQRGFAMLALSARPLALSPANALSLRNLKHPQTFSAFKTPRRTKGPCAFGF